MLGRQPTQDESVCQQSATPIIAVFFLAMGTKKYVWLLRNKISDALFLKFSLCTTYRFGKKSCTKETSRYIIVVS